jgi:demethylmenaquinone methyltransferase / 2-methoxy-6-polyprenyl-1,4-benzoquinol methylase
MRRQLVEVGRRGDADDVADVAVRLLGDLADGGDRDRLAHAIPTRHRNAGAVEREPRAAGGAVEGAEVRTSIGGGLRGDDGADRLPRRSEARRDGRGLLQLAPDLHVLEHKLGAMAEAVSARALFAPLGPTYDRYARLLSLGQDPRWRRFLVARVSAGSGDTVLDVATGTGAVALELMRQKACRVVGLDQSREMLAEARQRLGPEVRLVEGTAEKLPFPDESFDGLTFTYLLRYVVEPEATLRELARVVRPGATVAGLEFALPRGIWRPLWELYVRVGLPVAGRIISPGWARVGDFLGPSIRDFYARWPEDRLLDAWREAGIRDVRSQRLSVGGGIVTWGART